VETRDRTGRTKILLQTVARVEHTAVPHEK
jgi:hypothetical protein